MKSPGFRPATLIFDLGNVIVRYTPIGPDSALTSKCARGFDAVREIRFGEPWHCYERGEISTEAIFKEFKNKAGYSGSLAAFAVDFCEDFHFALDGETYGIINDIKQKYCVDLLLLSNLNPLHYECIKKICPGVFSSMRRCFLSFELRTRKPEPEIFRKVLEFAGWETGRNCLFIDDVQENLDAAKRLDFSVILHENASDTRRALGKYNIEI